MTVALLIGDGMATVETYFLADEQATVAAGTELSQRLRKGMTISLEGTLGAGKTTITRGILLGFGHVGAVKSPTYTLVEPYDTLSPVLYHFDLYRLGDPEELEYMGIRDYFSEHTICLVEWAERGEGVLPTPDVIIRLAPMACEKTGAMGRQLVIHFVTPPLAGD